MVGIPIILVLFLYIPFLGNAFVSDDIGGIVQSSSTWTIASSMGLPKVIHLGGLVLYGISHTFGIVPWPFRLVNILFHSANVIMVWLFVRKHSKPATAFVACLLFAVHPLAIESVTWISGGIAYAYYAFFFLVSLYWYRNTVFVKQLCSVLFFALALLFSEKAVPLVCVYILYEWVFGDVKQHWKHLVPYVVICSAFVFFYVFRIGERLVDLEAYGYYSTAGYYNPLIQIPVAISSYLELFVWPQRLTLYHSSFRYPPWEWGVRIMVTLGFFCASAYGIWKKRPFGFWLLWVICGLGVTLLPLKVAWIVAERYVYVGYIGLCVVSAMLFDTLLNSKRLNVLAVCGLVVCCVALGTRTIVRNNDWRTEDSLWISTAIVSSNNELSWNNMGDVFARHGEFDKSIGAFQRAIEINPKYADAYHNLGNTYVMMEAYDRAIPYFEKALSIRPNLWQSYQELGRIAYVKKEFDKAVEYFEQAIAIRPNEALLWTNVCQVYRASGETEKARQAVKHALSIDPQNQQARALEKLLKEQ